MISPLVVALALGGGPVNADTVGLVWADGRDAWTLHDQKLINRQLFLQLADPSQEFRLGRDLGPIAVAADVGVGAQVALPGSVQSRFHGFFLFESYWALRLFEGVEVNLSLNVFNPSASDGYRFSSQVNAGVALHLHREVFDLGGEPVTLDFAAIDLDLVTLGQGLLIERTPLEGHAASLHWGPVELRELFAGRTLWFDDDLQTVSLRLWRGMVEAMFAAWLTEDLPPGIPATLDVGEEPDALPRDVAYYVGLSASWPVHENLHIGVEYVGRPRPPAWKNGAMLRVDFLDRDLVPGWRRVQIHLGYQLRFYQRGFGPRDTLVTGTALPNLPTREDAYVTNSFEYLSVTRFYTQLSNTVMLETVVSLNDHLTVIGDVEYWARLVTDPRPGSKRVVYLDRFGRAPGLGHEVYYRAGLQLQPWAALPHRFKAYVGNKFVASAFDATVPDPRRFVHDPLVVLEVEVYL